MTESNQKQFCYYQFYLIRMRPTKTSHTFEVKGKEVKFSSNFDSGNLRTVTQIAANQFLIESALDSYETQVSFKSFFHFSVEKYPENQWLIMDIPKLSLLQCIKKDYRNRYRPCFSLNGESYQRLDKQNVKIIQKQQASVLRISFRITSSITYFSFSLPYSYERYLNMIRDLPNSHPDFYIKKQVLCYSKNLNFVYMITITSFDKKTDQQDIIGSANNGVILPQKHIDNQRIYFDKPVILLSARVHPGQSPSSWAIQGIIKYLISDNENAKLLRKYFQIVIVPMLNPDGVYEGMYRLDTMGHNLNRYYLISDNRQPSIYAMKHLIKHYDSTKRLLYYFDFHGHPSFKGSFMYGNAIDEIAYQAETQLFGRIMSLKCKTFEQKYCIFDREQMNSKDRFDMYTKQGCARVYAFKIANILHSYTVQMGFHACTAFNDNQTTLNQIEISDFLYDEEAYFQEGIAVLDSVLESCGLQTNFNRKQLRQQIANQIITREERFRKEDRNLSAKKKNVNEIVERQYWRPIKLKYFEKALEPKKKFITRQHTPKCIIRETSVKLEESKIKRSILSSELTARKIEVQECQQIDKKTIDITQEQKNNTFLLEKRKPNIEAKQIPFNFRNRKFFFQNIQFEHSKEVQKIQLKTFNIEEKKIQKIQRKSLQKKKINKYALNRSEQSMFSDNNIRDDGSLSKNVESSKAKFSMISNSKVNPYFNEIKEMFKLEKINKTPNLSNRRTVKSYKFNSLKL